MIGAGSQLMDAYIGPYTAIGDDVTIENAELEHSIVMSGSRISQLDYRIEASLIGKNVTIGRGPPLPKAYRFVVGDSADVQIPLDVALGGADRGERDEQERVEGPDEPGHDRRRAVPTSRRPRR